MDSYILAYRQASIYFTLAHRLSWKDALEYAWKLRTLNCLVRAEQDIGLYPTNYEIVWTYDAAYLPDFCWTCRIGYGSTEAGRIRYGCPACGYHQLRGYRPLDSLAAALSWPPELVEQLYLQWLAANPAYQQSTGYGHEV